MFTIGISTGTEMWQEEEEQDKSAENIETRAGLVTVVAVRNSEFDPFAVLVLLSLSSSPDIVLMTLETGFKKTGKIDPVLILHIVKNQSYLTVIGRPGPRDFVSLYLVLLKNTSPCLLLDMSVIFPYDFTKLSVLILT